MIRYLALPLSFAAVCGIATFGSARPADAADTANPVRGKTLFLQCAACHSVAAGAPNKVGPNLNGVVGAAAGTRPGFVYSGPMAAAKFRWDDAKLASFLERPSAVVPGTKMVFGGIADPAKRRDIIAYLRTAAK